jgi:choline kinase
VSAAQHAVIAAAGLGSRLGQGRPKCLVEVEGATILSRQLDLLAGVPDVRVVVGFQAAAVAAEARRWRPDVTLVENRDFATTTTLVSYALGARGVDSPCLFMDGDILFRPSSFERFVACGERLVVGYTDAKTADAVYVTVENDHVTQFDRSRPTPYEWANIAILPADYCEGADGAVFERLACDLPVPGAHVDSFEIDRPSDLALAAEAVRQGRLGDWAVSCPSRCQRELSIR